MKRFRIKYSKKEALKYTSGLEIQKIWERSLRRGHLPVAYSQGFHPQPRLNQAAPLPLGFTSSAEWIDIWFQDELTSEGLCETLPKVVPPGIGILDVAEIDLTTPTMQNRVSAAAYRVVFLDPISPAELSRHIDRILAATALPRIRREKEYDLRPLIEALALDTQAAEGAALIMTLAARPGATGRPEEVLLVMGLDPMETRIEKTETIFLDGE